MADTSTSLVILQIKETIKYIANDIVRPAVPNCHYIFNCDFELVFLFFCFLTSDIMIFVLLHEKKKNTLNYPQLKIFFLYNLN